MRGTQTATMRKALKEHEACELCGLTRGLEAHHIIPKVLGGSDEEGNLLVVCKKCHSLLTPTKELTKLGLHYRAWEQLFWNHFNEITGAGERIDAIDVFDYLEEYTFPVFRRMQEELHNVRH